MRIFFLFLIGFFLIRFLNRIFLTPRRPATPREHNHGKPESPKYSRENIEDAKFREIDATDSDGNKPS